MTTGRGNLWCNKGVVHQPVSGTDDATCRGKKPVRSITKPISDMATPSDKDRKHPADKSEEEIDEAVEESFPASDPPSHSRGTATPSEKTDEDEDEREA